MASGGLEELAEDLECPICREGLIVPKVLNCNHVFCADCLQQWLMGRTLACPICRREQVLDKHTGITELPEPLIIRQLQEKISLFLSGSQINTPISNSCGFCDGKATHICGSCMKSLCDDCTENHANNRITRTHRLILISKWTICQKHENELVNAYCQECNVGLCVMCMNKEHADHTVVDIKDNTLNRCKTDKLKKYMVRSERHSFNNEQLLRQLATFTNKLTHEYKDACARLENLRSEVNITIDDLQNKLHQQLSMELKKLQKYQSEIEEITATEKSLYGFIGDVLERKSKPDIIGACDELPDISSNTVSIPPKVRRACVTSDNFHEIISSIKGAVTVELEQPAVNMPPPTPPAKDFNIDIVYPSAPALEDTQVVQEISARSTRRNIDIRQVWETTLRRPVTDVVWDRKGPGWWIRSHGQPFGPGVLSYYDISGLLGDTIGQGVLEGKGKVCMDTTQDLLVTTDGARLICLRRTGEVVREITIPGYSNLSGVVFCNHTNVYVVSDTDKHCLLYISSENGELLRTVGCRGTADNQFKMPLYLCHQTLGLSDCHIIVSDCKNHCVKAFSAGGDFIRKYGCDGNRDHELSAPLGVNMNNNEEVLVCDSDNVRVVRFWWEDEEEKWEMALSKQQLGYRAPQCIDVFNEGQYMVLGMKGSEGVVRGFVYERL